MFSNLEVEIKWAVNCKNNLKIKVLNLKLVSN